MVRDQLLKSACLIKLWLENLEAVLQRNICCIILPSLERTTASPWSCTLALYTHTPMVKEWFTRINKIKEMEEIIDISQDQLHTFMTMWSCWSHFKTNEKLLRAIMECLLKCQSGVDGMWKGEWDNPFFPPPFPSNSHFIPLLRSLFPLFFFFGLVK